MTDHALTSIRTIAVPVSDLDEAKARFVGLGFTEAFDQELQPGFRWIELAVPGGGPNLALVAAADGLPAGVDTGIRFTTPDARAAHAAVAAAGCEVGELLDWDSAPLMFAFADPDDNRFYVSQVD